MMSFINKYNSDSQYIFTMAAMPLHAYALRMYASVVAFVYRLSVGFKFNFKSYLTCEFILTYVHVNDVWHVAVLKSDVRLKDFYIAPLHMYNVPVLPLLRDKYTGRSLGRIADVSMVGSELTRLGTDSHADISCIGSSGRILRVHENRTCLVRPFNDSYEPMRDVKLVDAAFKCRDEYGKQYILLVNQALDFTNTMTHSILCSNQARCNDVRVNDVPRICDNDSSQSVYFPKDGVEFPLSMHGPVAYLDISYPTDEDMRMYHHLELTSSETEWDPDRIFGNDPYLIDAVMEDKSDQMTCSGGFDNGDDSMESDLEKLENMIMISAINFQSKTQIRAAKLSELWNTVLDMAERTLKATTQHSLRQVDGKIHRRVRTKAHQRRYNQLGGHLARFSSDTFH